MNNKRRKRTHGRTAYSSKYFFAKQREIFLIGRLLSGSYRRVGFLIISATIRPFYRSFFYLCKKVVKNLTETLFMGYSLYVKLQQHKKYLLLKQKQMSKIGKMGIKNNTLKEVLEETLEIYKEITSNTKEALILFNQDNLINFSQK